MTFKSYLYGLNEAKAKRTRKGAGKGKPLNSEQKLAKQFVDNYKNRDIQEPVEIPKKLQQLIMKRGTDEMKKALKDYLKIYRELNENINEDAYFTKNVSKEMKKAEKENLEFQKTFKGKNKGKMSKLKQAFLGVLAGLMFLSSPVQAGWLDTINNTGRTIINTIQGETLESRIQYAVNLIEDVNKSIASEFPGMVNAAKLYAGIWNKVIQSDKRAENFFKNMAELQKLFGNSSKSSSELFSEIMIYKALAGETTAELDAFANAYFSATVEILSNSGFGASKYEKQISDGLQSNLKKELRVMLAQYKRKIPDAAQKVQTALMQNSMSPQTQPVKYSPTQQQNNFDYDFNYDYKYIKDVEVGGKYVQIASVKDGVPLKKDVERALEKNGIRPNHLSKKKTKNGWYKIVWDGNSDTGKLKINDALAFAKQNIDHESFFTNIKMEKTVEISKIKKFNSNTADGYYLELDYYSRDAKYISTDAVKWMKYFNKTEKDLLKEYHAPSDETLVYLKLADSKANYLELAKKVNNFKSKMNHTGTTQIYQSGKYIDSINAPKYLD